VLKSMSGRSGVGGGGLGPGFMLRAYLWSPGPHACVALRARTTHVPVEGSEGLAVSGLSCVACQWAFVLRAVSHDILHLGHGGRLINYGVTTLALSACDSAPQVHSVHVEFREGHPRAGEAVTDMHGFCDGGEYTLDLSQEWCVGEAP
jgi:hypothetical protein